MAKQKPYRSPVKMREKYPLTRKDKQGHIEMLCPFCVTPHVISPRMPSPCGTTIQVKAVQKLITARTAKNEGVKCMKCHDDKGGDMAMCRNGFVHIHDCAPGVVVLPAEPKYSKWAERVFKLPEALRKRIEKRFGEVKEISEIDQDGKETGKILGYFFYKDSV